jgi:xanthine dehydrogenase accessory factor
MKEIKAIISAYDRIDKTTTHSALATVVRVDGSSYRRAGARMLVMDDGVWVGGISGGCLEGDALKRARLAIANEKPSLITYDTSEADAYQIGVGLGCNGIIDVLFTPLDFKNRKNPVELLKSCVQQDRQTHVLITITRLEGKWMHIHTGDLIPFHHPDDLKIVDDALLEKQLLDKIIQHKESGKSASDYFELADRRRLSVFIEILLPEMHLILMGHQYDIYPLSRLIKEIGWRVSIVASPLKVNHNLAGIADTICGLDQLSQMTIDEYTAILLMSHDYQTDKTNLPKALETKAPYVGMLGPRVRAEKIFRELMEEGKGVSEQDKERIYAPAGLDIGALTPEEIALSLLAEIRAVFSQRDGSSLRLRQSSIHERN